MNKTHDMISQPARLFLSVNRNHPQSDGVIAPVQATIPAITMSLFSCKGGVGTTFLTSQLGYVLSQQRQRRVLIVDCVYPYGDLGLMLGETGLAGSMGELLRNPARIDGHLLESVMANPYPDLKVLSGCDLTGLSREDFQRGLGRILELSRERFDVILLDCGRQPEPASMPLLQQADRLVPVLLASLPMVRDARRLLSSLRAQGISREQIMPVLSRHQTASAALTQALEQALGSALPHRIPEHPELVLGAVMTGFPVPRMFPRHQLSRKIGSLGRALMGESQGDSYQPKGFWQRWWKRRQPPDPVTPKVVPTAVTVRG